MGSTLRLQPISQKDAKEYIRLNHRHHPPPVGWKFGVAANDGAFVVGVIIVSRPVSRVLDNGWTLEVTRCCTDGTHNACSFLYAAAWRATQAIGYKRLVTYTLPSEGGASLRAAGWEPVGFTEGGTWNTPSRPRVDNHPIDPKAIWAKYAKGYMVNRNGGPGGAQ